MATGKARLLARRVRPGLHHRDTGTHLLAIDHGTHAAVANADTRYIGDCIEFARCSQPQGDA
jgi:hypothetical protein